MKTALLFVPVISLFVGCSYHGEYAKVSQSKNFSIHSPMRVMVVPFSVEGNPDFHNNAAIADQVAASLLDLGFVIIDHNAVQAKASELAIALDDKTTQADFQRLATALKAEALFTGDIDYRYNPAESGTTPLHIETKQNGKGNIAGVDVHGGESYKVDASYTPVEMSARLISLPGYEVLFNEHIKPEYWRNAWGVGNYFMPDELADAIKVQLK